MNKDCDCFDIEYPILNANISSCIDSHSQYVCSTNFTMGTGDNVLFKEDCEAECPTECDRIEFDYTLSGYEVIFSLNFKILFQS